MSRATPILAILTTWLLAAAVAAALPSAPRTHVLDQTGLLQASEKRVLETSLADFERRTGIQMLVAVLERLEGSVEEDAVALYEDWGIGQRGEDRGVLFCIWPNDRRTRIEVGYGLEGDLNDAKVGRILRAMQELPANQAGQGVAYVLADIAAQIAPDDPLAGGQFGGSLRRESGGEGGSKGSIIGTLIKLIILIAIFGGGGLGRSRWLGPLVIMSAMGGGRRGGGGGFGGGGFGGGGGFSGGGGMSGGGGASGGW